MTHFVAQRAYFSREHIAAAAMHARGARRAELEHVGQSLYLPEHRAHAMGAVIFAVAALEAAINELCSDASEGNLYNLRPVDETVIKRIGAMWIAGVPRTASYSVVEKYAIVLQLADRQGFDTGAEPWQSAAELAKLRNALVHYEPEWVPMAVVQEKHKFERALQGKFAPNPLAPPENPYYPDKILGHGCAEWSVRSAITFAGEFATRLGIFHNPLGNIDLPELSTNGPA